MSRNRFVKQKRGTAVLKEILLPAVILTLVLALFIPGVASIDSAANRAAKTSLETAIRRSAAHCYATEGRYPDSLSYLEEHYGIRIDESKYTVLYQVFASNLMPVISVAEK